MILTDASDTQIDAVLAGTHALWSDGLERAAYHAYVRALRETPWGRRGGYRFLVLCDDAGRVVSAMKLYRFEARAAGRRITLGGVGALFTPPEQRGRGHASRLLELVHGEMAARGDAAALLHSEIGDAYYARLGYRRIDPDAGELRVPPSGATGASAGRLRRLGPGEDSPALLRLREAEDDRGAFALVRDAEYWGYLRARAEIPSWHLGEDRWQSRLVVHERQGVARGYLWSLLREPSEAAAHDGGASARVLEFAESTPGESLPGMLEDLFGECRRRGITGVEVWQAGELARRVAPDLAWFPPARPLPVIPMWRPLIPELAPGLSEALVDAPLLLSDVF